MTLTLTNEVGTLVIQLSDSIVVNNCVTEIPTIEVKESTLVFPNPFTDILQIKADCGECLYCIRDICGRLVYMKRENENEITTINMGYLSRACIFLKYPVKDSDTHKKSSNNENFSRLCFDSNIHNDVPAILLESET
ncbi:MAG: hypothetical protein IPN36_05905 [Bacteroidetes bacterium]|nr:hypothetical protein [Bacteroidota bacterium]